MLVVWLRAAALSLLLSGCGGSDPDRPTDGGAGPDDASAPEAGTDGSTPTDAGATDSALPDAAGADACVASSEICNGVDDDCNGLPDDGADDVLCAARGGTCIDGRCRSAGYHVYSEFLPGGSGSHGADIVVDDANDPIVVGSLPGSSREVGTGPLDPGNTLLASLRGADASVQWAIRGGAPATNDDSPSALARTAAGVLYVGGALRDTADFGTGPLTPADRGDGFIVRYDATGMPTHAWLLGTSSTATVDDLAISATGDVIAVGDFTGTLTVGTTVLVADVSDVFVARFDATGAPLSAFSLGGSGTANGHSIAIAPGGDYFVGGRFQGALTIGATTLTAVASSDGYLARLSPTGADRWVRQVGSAGGDSTNAVVTPAAGGVCAAGMFGRMFDFGLGDLTPADNRDGFVACYDGSGAIRWADAVGGGRGSPVHGMALDADDNLFIAGNAHPTVRFQDVYAASYQPDGTPRWGTTLSTPTTSEFATAIAVGTDHQVYVTGGQPIRLWRFAD